MRNSGPLAAAGCVLALLVASGCSAPPAPTSGAAEQTKTLTVATDDEPGRPSAAQIEEYARQVKELSGGKLLIEPVWKVVGDGMDDWDQAVARGVVANHFDMAVVPVRAWDTEGVTAFAGLHAPFLVTSNSLMEKVAAPEIADELLAGLEKIGVTGLALFPESPRMLFAFGKPALKPSDFAGKTVRAARSDTTYAVLKSLGATPDDLVGGQFPDGLAAGTVAAAESSFALAGDLPEPSIATGNLILYPKINSLVVNAKVLKDLGEAERQWLKDAAAGTRRWADEALPAIADDAARFCRDGGTVVTATDAEVAAFKAAAAPVYTQLERDPGTKALIAKIRALASSEPAAAAVRPCKPGG
ncbi:TRAP transporter substrate-binding protein [Arthrobacter sp. ZGTC131]|uniref:TRAP transporter substrate-binding protein n=1 Tax=Arthrobacter sp. ZGTC131 TaxID=2058898 RepID=UPI000CE4D109|nr:TRAP transporter substrate-binding protein DctP [Arthrobacter sp. ZGTC131]